MENNLDEWVTGDHVPVSFSQSAYEQKYITHLKRLKEFDEKTKDLNIVPQIRRRLLKKARYVSTTTRKYEDSLYTVPFSGYTPK